MRPQHLRGIVCTLRHPQLRSASDPALRQIRVGPQHRAQCSALLVCQCMGPMQCSACVPVPPACHQQLRGVLCRRRPCARWRGTRTGSPRTGAARRTRARCVRSSRRCSSTRWCCLRRRRSRCCCCRGSASSSRAPRTTSPPSCTRRASRPLRLCLGRARHAALVTTHPCCVCGAARSAEFPAHTAPCSVRCSAPRPAPTATRSAEHRVPLQRGPRVLHGVL